MEKTLIAIPTYNEKENIALILDKLMSLYQSFDILVIDDNSPDGTGTIVEQIIQTQLDQKKKQRLFLLSRAKKEGLGKAYVAAFHWALERDYDYIFEMDADFSHAPNDLKKLWTELRKTEVDMVIGSRYIDGVNVVNWPLSRLLLSYFASKYVYLITHMPIKDPTAGFVGYTAKALRNIDLKHIKFKGYAFQIEMKYMIWKKGFGIREVSIVFRDRKQGVSKLSYHIIKESIFGVFQMRFRSIK